MVLILYHIVLHVLSYNLLEIEKKTIRQVSALYRDASIGNAINIVMVRLMLLENESLEVSQNNNKGGGEAKHIRGPFVMSMQTLQ